MKDITIRKIGVAILCFIIAITFMPIQTFADTEKETTSGIVNTCKWEIDDKGVLTFSPVDGSYGELDVYSNNPWNGNDSINSVKVVGNIKILNSASYLFIECSNLKTVDLTGFDTSDVDEMCQMFCSCASLKSVNFGGIDTSKVKDMYEMFYACTSLESIDLSSLDTSKVTDMTGMFDLCTSLKSINMTKCNTGYVDCFARMFSRCTSLESIDLSSFTTSYAKNFQDMFSGCTSLKSIDLSESDVFCKCKFPKVAGKNGEPCISVLEKVAGCPAGLPRRCRNSTADM